MSMPESVLYQGGKTMREYTIDDFGFESITEESHGQWEQSRKDPETGMFVINSSSVLTALIQIAGRICKRFASDLFIDWKSIDAALRDKSYNGGKYLFGFRENGIDHAAYVLGRLNDSWMHYKHQIKEIYLLEIKVEQATEYPYEIEIRMSFGPARLMEDAGLLDGQAA